jgi:hypothetical protein
MAMNITVFQNVTVFTGRHIFKTGSIWTQHVHLKCWYLFTKLCNISQTTITSIIKILNKLLDLFMVMQFVTCLAFQTDCI